MGIDNIVFHPGIHGTWPEQEGGGGEAQNINQNFFKRNEQSYLISINSSLWTFKMHSSIQKRST